MTRYAIPVLDRRAILAAGLALAACQTEPASPQAESDVEKEIRQKLDAAVARGLAPWAILHVTRSDRDVMVHASGIDASHVDVLRSATKVATVTAVMTLVRDGAVALEDSVARFIPAFGGDKSGITVRHLLSMNSGLPSQWRGFSDAVPLSEGAGAIANVPLAARPGERFIYGNLGLTVAGRVAEIASGRPWDQFFSDALASPLGLKFDYVPLETGRLGGGGRTNAESYAKLLRLHLGRGVHNGAAFLPAELMDTMQASNGSRFVNPIPEIQPQGYGMGWWFDAVDASGAPLVISDPGAWGTYPWIDRTRRYGAILFVRKQLAQGVALQREIKPLVDRLVEM